MSAAETWNLCSGSLKSTSTRQGRGHTLVSAVGCFTVDKAVVIEILTVVLSKGGGSRVTFCRLIGSGKETLQTFPFEGHKLVVIDRAVLLATHFKPHTVRLWYAGQSL